MPRTSALPIQQTLWEIERRWGQGTLTRASMLQPGRVIPTGFAALDALLDRGGIAVGQMSAVVGAPTSGATTLIYRLIARAQQNEGIAAYIDLDGVFDAEYAAGCGVALDRLLVVAPRGAVASHTLARGLEIALDVVRTDQVALVVLDISTAAHHVDGEALERLRANIARTRGALVLLTRTPRSPALLHTLIRLRHDGWIVSPEGEVRGYQACADVLRDGGTERRRSARLPIELAELAALAAEGPSA